MDRYPGMVEPWLDMIAAYRRGIAEGPRIFADIAARTPFEPFEMP